MTLPDNVPFEKSGLGGSLKAQDWFALGVTPRDGNTSFGQLDAALVLPQGRFGPAFLTYPNFAIYLEWNKSFIYTTRRLFRHAARRRAALPEGQSRTGPRHRRHEGAADQARSAGP